MSVCCLPRLQAYIAVECVPNGALACRPDAMGNVGLGNVGADNFGRGCVGNNNIGAASAQECGGPHSLAAGVGLAAKGRALLCTNGATGCQCGDPAWLLGVVYQRQPRGGTVPHWCSYSHTVIVV